MILPIFLISQIRWLSLNLHSKLQCLPLPHYLVEVGSHKRAPTDTWRSKSLIAQPRLGVDWLFAM